MNHARRKEMLAARFAAKIEAAKQQQQDTLDSAWVDAKPSICGITIRHLRVADILVLEAAQNAFISSRRQPTPGDVQQFLWWLSPRFSLSKCRRFLFMFRIRKLDFAQAAAEIGQYVDSVFEGEAASKSGSNDDGPKVSFISGLVHAIAITYHWSRQDILDAPLAQLLQCKRLIHDDNSRASGKRTMHLGGEADKLWAEYLAELNEIEAQEREAIK